MTASAAFPKLAHGLVAILRGLRPEEAVDMASAVFEAGIEAIEVPLNSPDPFTSIERIVSALPPSAAGPSATASTRAGG